MGADALRDLVLVVREDQVEAAAVDVEGLAQRVLAHRRAFDVPAGPAAAPRAVPAGLVRGRRLPQHEIAGVFLVGRDLDAGAGDQVGAAAPRQRAVFGVGGDAEQRMPLGGVGVARGDQPLDQRDHLLDVFGGARLDVGRQVAEHRHVGVKLCRRARRHLVDRLAAGARRGHDLVLDIGDVADIGDVVRAVFVAQHAVEQVEGDDRASIADVGLVVDRRAADIHPDPLGIERRERLLAVGQRIVEDERHRAGDHGK